MNVEETMRAKLTTAFAPSALEIDNESHQHHGHHGSPATGESHFRIHIVSARFAGKRLVERHRLVNEALQDELAGPVHALAMRTLAPGEA